MEDVEQMFPLEGTLCFQVSKGIMNGLLFVSDHNCRCWTHKSKKLPEDPRVGKHWLAIGDNKPKNYDPFWGVCAQEKSDHVLSIVGSSLPNNAESQIKADPAPKLLEMSLHFGSDH